MKKHFSVLALLLLTVACQQNKRLPRIAIAGLAIESSTFSPQITQEEDFLLFEVHFIIDLLSISKKRVGRHQKSSMVSDTKSESPTGGGRITRGL